MERDTRDTAATLAAQETETVRLWQVPKDSQDEKMPDEVVIVNGHAYQIQRGVSVEVPLTVAEILRQSNRF